MPFGTGLDAQIMFGQETTYGTAVTPTRSLEFNSEGLTQDITYLDSSGIRKGNAFKRTSRTIQSRFSVDGDVEMEIGTLGMGLLVKHMLGSTVTTTTQIAATTAYKQIHVPGGSQGLALTTQVGKPEPGTGTVVPFTYAGCKVSKWEISLKDNAIPTLKLTLTGRAETTATALATTAFLTGTKVFSFKDATLKLGGTAATASGETTITSGTAVAALVKGITISGDNSLATDRFGIGNAGLKKEPLQNNMNTITGSLDAEFAKTELYDVYTAGTPTPLQFDMTGSLIASGNNFLFSIILPSTIFKKAAPNVNGPDIVQMKTDFEAEWDEVNPPIQIKIVSTESTNI
ncbi:phage tail tube protein [Amycolatopsis sp. NPDC088138]|uniref:phage tail tube protein n=1 Tax=Amycolatopsis sp. NPDC088138 TaxID=3363938 RepID=UPI003823AA3F